jgi:hypothetical protein
VVLRSFAHNPESPTAKDAEDAKEKKSFTAKDAEDAKEELMEAISKTPSPRVNGERVGVRGNKPANSIRKTQRPSRPLTLALSPSRGEGILEMSSRYI